MKSHIQIAVEVVVCHSGVDGVEGDVGGGDGIDVIFRGMLVVVVVVVVLMLYSERQWWWW